MTGQNKSLQQDIGLLVLLWFTGLYLRLPILVAPPLAPFIGSDLDMSQAQIGALTTLPVFMLALGALLGSLLIMRVGPRNALAGALALVALASAARGTAPDSLIVLLFSGIMGLGIAIMQPSLPALLPRWFTPGRIALATACYMNGMLMGEFIGAGLTLPVIMPLADGSWRLTLAIWSLPALLVAAALLIPGNGSPAPAGPPRWLPDPRDPLMWKMGLLLAGTASLFFGTNAYMGSVLEARGEAERLDSALFWFNIAQVAASLFMMGMAGRWVARRGPILFSATTSVLTMLGFLLIDGWVGVVFAFAVSFFAGILLILLVALPPQLLDSSHSGRLSAGNFTIGYTLAFVIPLLGGILADLTNNPVVAVWVILAFAAMTLPFAMLLRLDGPSNNKTS